MCHMSAALNIRIMQAAEDDLSALRVFDQRRIMDAILAELAHEPDVPTKNRKRLEDVTATFEHAPPVWELRVGQFRVFYDISMEEGTVFVRAVRQKKPGQTTAEIVT